MTFTSTQTLLTKPRVLTMQPVYADSYQGEWVNYSLGDRVERKYYQPNSQFHRPRGRAVVLGNGLSRTRYGLDKLNQSNKIKHLHNYNIIYGCNRAYEEKGELDFLVLTNRFLITEIAKDNRHHIYTTPEVQRTAPGTNLIPLHYRLDAGSAAAMLACFHGAGQVFLFGFDGQVKRSFNHNIYAGTRFYGSVDDDINDTEWHENLKAVVMAYPNTTFYRIDVNPPGARSMTVLPNYKLITFTEFVSLADL